MRIRAHFKSLCGGSKPTLGWWWVITCIGGIPHRPAETDNDSVSSWPYHTSSAYFPGFARSYYATLGRSEGEKKTGKLSWLISCPLGPGDISCEADQSDSLLLNNDIYLLLPSSCFPSPLTTNRSHRLLHYGICYFWLAYFFRCLKFSRAFPVFFLSPSSLLSYRTVALMASAELLCTS